MDGAFYVDMLGSYDVTDKFTAYSKVDNVFDHAPAPAPASNVTYGFNPLLYDVLGRMFRLGARYNF